MKEESDISSLVGEQSLGAQVSTLRALLGMTKTDFAFKLHASRATEDRIEKGDITLDLAYKLYYVANKVYLNVFNSDLLRLYAKNFMERIDKEIIEKGTVKATNKEMITIAPTRCKKVIIKDLTNGTSVESTVATTMVAVSAQSKTKKANNVTIESDAERQRRDKTSPKKREENTKRDVLSTIKHNGGLKHTTSQ